MKYKIFKPSKSAMQSGLNNTKYWCIEPIDKSKKRIYKNFGISFVSNAESQIRLFFDDLKSAVNYAKSINMDYEIKQYKERKILKKSYAENFKPKKN